MKPISFIDSELYNIKDVYGKYDAWFDHQTLREEIQKNKLSKLKKGRLNYYQGSDLNEMFKKIIPDPEVIT